MDTCAQLAVVVLMLVSAGCAHADRREPAPTPKPPFAGCQKKPAALPKIATGVQLKARHDKLDALYDDCAARLRRNLDAPR